MKFFILAYLQKSYETTKVSGFLLLAHLMFYVYDLETDASSSGPLSSTHHDSWGTSSSSSSLLVFYDCRFDEIFFHFEKNQSWIFRFYCFCLIEITHHESWREAQARFHCWYFTIVDLMRFLLFHFEENQSCLFRFYFFILKWLFLKC